MQNWPSTYTIQFNIYRSMIVHVSHNLEKIIFRKSLQEKRKKNDSNSEYNYLTSSKSYDIHVFPRGYLGLSNWWLQVYTCYMMPCLCSFRERQVFVQSISQESWYKVWKNISYMCILQLKWFQIRLLPTSFLVQEINKRLAIFNLLWCIYIYIYINRIRTETLP